MAGGRPKGRTRRAGPSLAELEAQAEDLAVMAGGGRQARQEAAQWLAAQSARLEAARPEDDALVIDADCADAARVFLAMGTQWRFEPMGGHGFRVRSGLDYGALNVVAAAHGVAVCPGLLADLQEMEIETRVVDLEHARKAAGR